MTGPGPDKTAKDAREERLKQALRANLKRRKAQTRARRDGAAIGDPGCTENTDPGQIPDMRTGKTSDNE